MASLSTGADGLHRVYFKAADGRRQCLYLGRIAKKQAEGIERCVTDLERANLDGSTPSETTSRWLAEVSDELHARLAKFGMVRDRVTETAAVVVALGDLVARFKARPKWANLKVGTQESISRAIRHLLLYFDATTPITKITAAAVVAATRWSASKLASRCSRRSLRPRTDSSTDWPAGVG